MTATCSQCGPIVLDPSECRLVAYGRADPVFITYPCRTCHRDNKRDVEGDVMRMLVRGGVPVVRLRVEIPVQGPPITLDDLIDLGKDMTAL